MKCPENFKGRYTVRQGDTLSILANIFRTEILSLIRANPHIKDPDNLLIGDTLCVPSIIKVPSVIELVPKTHIPFGSYGYILASYAPRGGQSITFTTTLPYPMYFGNFDTYVASVEFKEVGEFTGELYPTPEDPPTWSSRIELPTALLITPGSLAKIKAVNSESGKGLTIFSNYIN